MLLGNIGLSYILNQKVLYSLPGILFISVRASCPFILLIYSLLLQFVSAQPTLNFQILNFEDKCILNMILKSLNFVLNFHIFLKWYLMGFQTKVHILFLWDKWFYSYSVDLFMTELFTISSSSSLETKTDCSCITLFTLFLALLWTSSILFDKLYIVFSWS